MASEIRYAYSYHKNQERAADALEQYYADGSVSAGERPKVERKSGFWAVTLQDVNLTAYL